MLIHKGSKTLETERLILRKFQYTDDDDMLPYWIRDPNIQY
jgi:ribosomal-protein-alanine N-acetyltransferase